VESKIRDATAAATNLLTTPNPDSNPGRHDGVLSVHRGGASALGKLRNEKFASQNQEIVHFGLHGGRYSVTSDLLTLAHGGNAMDRSSSGWLRVFRQTGVKRGMRRVSRGKAVIGCEALDCRRLLSTGAAILLTPPTTAVSNAAAILESLDPTTFARLQADLVRAEGHSHVSQNQAGLLAQDEAALDNLVNAAGLDPDSTNGDMNRVQDAVDEAFHPTLDRPETWAKDKRTLEQYLSDVPGSTPLINQTIAQVHVVARGARVSGPLQRTLSRDEQILTAELGPSPDADLGPGAVDRDPLEVYYNGQVDGFIK
jgi:hypothetical protein